MLRPECFAGRIYARRDRPAIEARRPSPHTVALLSVAVEAARAGQIGPEAKAAVPR